MNRLFAALIALVLHSACGPTPSSDDAGPRDDAGPFDDVAIDVEPGDSDGGVLASACLETQMANGMTECTRAFGEAPLVRLPPDYDEGGARFVYGGFGHPEGDADARAFIGRGTQIDQADFDFDFAATPDFLEVHYGYQLYRGRVVAGRLESYEPVLRINDMVFQRLFAGTTFEGHLSAREVIGDEVTFTYLEHPIPTRIEFDAAPDEVPAGGVDGADRFRVYGRIVNATRSVRNSNGECLASLESFGERNPLFSATDTTGQVYILRHPNMHGNMDDVFTFDWPAGVSGANNMGGGLFIPASALLREAFTTPGDGSNSTHGAPASGPDAELILVDSGEGGEDCTL